ncbi:hypothetical protein PUNSTDRAFT_141891 [Punctularia strigosozonata HHB-11173 SS5]|uniref:uncharacterized protein n=1 Tax=Punctularia strigosozonata (strain HHB-11173) TaxID=741275 RepID=UPI0004416708|nr:uncharacterized protein PUNSTDRAFT_141891 [Punctularia strigosozonata HHB-11173 SS5]EIN11563.1 hypothetical protein PUNSTDRAFT_141891 [Punctularia strigosozonata HHB-11173 SS5]
MQIGTRNNKTPTGHGDARGSNTITAAGGAVQSLGLLAALSHLRPPPPQAGTALLFLLLPLPIPPAPMRASDSSASSSSAAAMPARHKKRRFTREQLLEHIEILGAISAPLPPTLPPSPPASRTSSPAPGSKRKHASDPDKDADKPKRPRTTIPNGAAPTDRPRQSQPQHRPTNLRTDSAEDGEVRDDAPRPSTTTAATTTATAAAAISSPPSTNALAPIRRPRRGKFDKARVDTMYQNLYGAARLLKYSSEARLHSTYPVSAPEHKPLPNPPPPDSTYHQHGGMIARLEGLDALICFTYASWARDMLRKGCDRKAWEGVLGLMGWWTSRWAPSDSVGERERALLGVIYMLQGFIMGRMVTFANQYTLMPELNKLKTRQEQLAAEAAALAAQSLPFGTNASTPPMLPSPAGTNSANSTPNVKPQQQGPGTSSSGSSLAAPGGAKEPHPAASIAAARLQAAPPATNPVDVPVPVQASFLSTLREHADQDQRARECLMKAQMVLTLPTLLQHFPKTFSRVVHTTLSAADEHEPDIDDDDGELYWPGQAITGEGIGWVCLMGKAMLREIGREYGYMGLSGAVPKPASNAVPKP